MSELGESKFQEIITYLTFKHNFEKIGIDYKKNQGPFLEMLNIYFKPASAITTMEGLQSFMDGLKKGLRSEGLEVSLQDKVYKESGQIVGRLYYDEVISDDYLRCKGIMAQGKPERRILVTVLPNFEKAIEDLIEDVDRKRDFLRNFKKK